MATFLLYFALLILCVAYVLSIIEEHKLIKYYKNMEKLGDSYRREQERRSEK